MAYRTVSYESVLRGIANLGGVKRDQLLSDTSSLLFEFINEAVRMGWEHDWFPDIMALEKRYWRDGLWSAGTYPDGAIVYYSTDEVYYENTSGGNTTETPSSTASDWTQITDFARYISLTQMTGTNLATAETKIDQVKNIYQKDPDLNENRGPSAFRITHNGIQPISFDFDFCWVEFKKRPADMSGMVEWDSTATYAVGDWVYYEGSTTPLAGEAYEVIVATTAGQDPQDTPASFTKFDFPYTLAKYVKHQALADWLGAGGGATDMGADQSSIARQNWLQNKAQSILENESYNLRGKSRQYSNYELRQI
jgi:hypothetical protein